MSGPTDTVISINNPKYSSLNPKYSSSEPYQIESNILCLNLSTYSQLTQFFLCAFYVFICYLSFGYFLELVYSNQDLKSVSLYITLLQFIFTLGCAYVEFLIRMKIERKVPLRTYALIAALTLGTISFSNMSLSYLNYPTQLIFKSCKLIPVMIGSIFIVGKRYGFLDYLAAIIMCTGLTMFTLADLQTSPKFDFLGVIIISLALLCDAVIGNIQERAMKTYQATNNEIVFYSYSIAAIYLLCIVTVSGTLVEGYTYCSQNPQKIYLNVFCLSVSNYLGLQGVLTLVRLFGATIAVTVTTMRKAMSIVISFLLFAKPFTFQYVWSGMLVALAIYLNHQSKKHPSYVPMPILRLWNCLRKMYDHELQHVMMRTQPGKSYI